MKTGKTARRSAAVGKSLVLALALALALAGALPGRASRAAELWPPTRAESWPPSTPPRIDLAPDGPPATAPTPPRAAAPRPAAKAPAPPPVAPALVAKAPPPLPVPPPPAPPAAPAHDRGDSDEDATVVRRSDEPESPHLRFVYGSRDGQFFARSLGDEVVFLPSVRLQINGNTSSSAQTSSSSLGVGLARVDAAGWLYSKVYFDFSADFASGPSLRYVDNYIAVAPWRDRVIFQLGQFDAPFTLENRTSDRYLDFTERGVSIRSFAIPENKDQGLMVHGTNDARNYYYSAAVLTGKGPTVSGLDGQLDVMARAWIAPLSFRGPPAVSGVTFGVSGWTGDRVVGPVYKGLTTNSGFPVVDPGAWWTTGSPSSLVVRERGRLYAGALELNAPVAHRFGARVEWIAKKQPLSAMDPSDPAHMISGGINLSGWATYGEIWGWVLGNDRMFGPAATPGLALPTRLGDLSGDATRHGLMVAARLDYVDQQVALTDYSKMVGLDAGSIGETRLTSLTLGATYWYTRRARVNLNYAFNYFDGTTPYILGLGYKSEQELLLQTAFAL